MFDTVAAAYRRFLVRWTDAVRRAAAVVVVGALALAIAAGAYFVGAVAIDTDINDMLSPDLGFRVDEIAVAEAFPQFRGTLVAVVEADNPDLAEDSAAALAARLAARPELFSFVFHAESEPFFRRNGLLYLDADELYDLSDRLSEAQPFLGALWQDPSLRGLADMLALAADEALDAEGEAAIEVADVYDAVAEVAEAQAAGEAGTLSWRRLMAGEDADAGRQIVLAKPVRDFSRLAPAGPAIRAVREAARAVAPEAGAVSVRLTGSAALRHEELKSVQQGMGVAAALSLALVVGLLLLCFRSLRLAAATLFTLVVGLVWTAAFAIAALGHLNLISVAFAVLFIGLSVDFGIHYGLRYREALDRDVGHAAALAEAADGVGGALTLCAVAAAIGFFSFLPTDYVGLAELGLISGAGMFIALAANLTVLPAVLTVLTPTPRPARDAGAAPPGADLVRRRPRAIVWGAAALAVAALATAPGVRFDFDPLNLRDPATESVSTLFELMDESRTQGYAITVLADDLAGARALAERIELLDVADGTATLAALVPDDQETKLEIVDTLSLILEASLVSPRADAATDAERRAAIEALRPKLAALAETGDDDTAAAARRLDAALGRVVEGGGAALADLERRLLIGLEGRLAALRDSLAADAVEVETIPDGLRRQWVADDGRSRLQVFARAPIHRDPDALEAFSEAVRTLAPSATGSPIVIVEARRAVVRAFVEAAVIAVAAIAVMLALLLKGVREVVLVFAPLALAAALTVAGAAVIGQAFNFANVIALPLLFGLGVAGGLHLVMREREEGGAARLFATSTPRAVVFSALTTIGSFGSIALSSHPGTASMGVLLTLAIVMTLACALIVLPAAMAVWPPARRA